MTLKFNKVLSRYMLVQNFIELSAAVHEFCVDKKRKNCDSLIVFQIHFAIGG